MGRRSETGIAIEATVSKEMDRFLAKNHSVTTLALDRFEKELTRQCDQLRGSPNRAP